MKISTASNFPEDQNRSSEESLTDTISISGDSDLDAVSAAGESNKMIQELKKTINRNLIQISSLENKLKITEIHLECQKNNVVRVLDELKSKMIESQKIEDGLRKQVYELNKNLLSVSSKLKEESEKLAEYTFNIASSPAKEKIVPLNNTKDPKIKVIQRDGIQPFMAVIEDIPSAGTGWMVIQRRNDGQVPFATNSEDSYGDAYGFGDLKTNFWLGAKKIHQLTTRQWHELYIQVVDLDDVIAYARYDHFEIGSKDEQYKIKSLGSYSGNAGDAFRSLQNAPLEKGTLSDNRIVYWWINTQMNCNLNGQYKSEDRGGFYWGRWCLGKKRCQLKSCQMLIRPRTS